MKFRIALFTLLAVWTVGVARYSVSAQTPAKSVWDGVYTEEQAKRGEAAYTQNCSECHQQELTGDGFAPALTGGEFMNNWNGLTVGDLFERIRVSMPPGQEAAVSNQTKADIVAHILAFNKFPAGKTELAGQTEPLKQVKFEANKQ